VVDDTQVEGSDSPAMMKYLQKQYFGLLHILAGSQQREKETDGNVGWQELAENIGSRVSCQY
jgi:hypothetical protein